MGGGQGGRTGTGGHRPPLWEGDGQAEAQPERGTQGGLLAGTGGDTPRNGRSKLLGKCAGWRRRRATAGRSPDRWGRLPRTWRHPTPFHSGRTAGGAQAAGLLDLRSAGKGLRETAGPRVTVPGGVGSALLETTAEAGQAVHP
ncbi:hypothetical protein NDU88_005445 [Pleurodeles waltl]|uniref:Uncharacterized protein n=1 Tax=Pleurodeles waltl TaxID=8319 RepID=A0AAV7MB01_PLEWA|nr:hypothetical protein NDU88_005445 [Pleurodeles waltl]